MSKGVHIMDADEVVLLKSASVQIDRLTSLFIFLTYHREEGDRSKTFYRCDACYDKNFNWLKRAESLVGAEPFRLSDLGGKNDYRLFYARAYFTKSRAGIWLKKKLLRSHIRKYEEFVNTEYLNANGNIKEYYMETFNIGETEKTVNLRDLEELKKHRGMWLWSYKSKKPRKSYGRVIY